MNQPLQKFVLLSLGMAFLYFLVVRLGGLFLDEALTMVLKKYARLLFGLIFVITGFLIYRTHKNHN